MKNRKTKLEEIFYQNTSPAERLAYDLKKEQKKVSQLENLPVETVEKIVEKEVVKEVENPISGETIVKLINELELTKPKQIDFTHIKNFPWDDVRRMGGSNDGGFTGYGAYDLNLKQVTLGQITSNQNNYTIGLGSWFRISSDAARDITGFEGGTDGKGFLLTNVGSFAITLKNQSASSQAGNRILNETGADIVLATNDTAWLLYDSTTERWRGILHSVGGGSVGPGTINELAYFDTANTIASLSVATYPSLTELSYVKGLTSSAQTQLNGKQASMGADDNYVTDAQLTVIQNTSGVNTGNQDLSGLVPYTGATGDVDLGLNGITLTDITIGANTLTTLEWANLDGLNQTLATTSSPTFANITDSGVTLGSVLFAGTAGLITQDNTNLFFDDTNNIFRVGSNTITATDGRVTITTPNFGRGSSGLMSGYYTTTKILDVYMDSGYVVHFEQPRATGSPGFAFDVNNSTKLSVNPTGLQMNLPAGFAITYSIESYGTSWRQRFTTGGGDVAYRINSISTTEFELRAEAQNASATLKNMTLTADILKLKSGTSIDFAQNVADTDLTFNFLGTTNSGQFLWMEDEDYRKEMDDILMNSTERIYFNDTSSSIYDDGTDLILISNGIVKTAQTFQAGGYNSSDGSAGATGTFTTVDLKTVTVKNGIITSIL